MFIVLKVILASGVTNRAVLIYATVTNLRSCHRLPPYILYLCNLSLLISASTIYAAATACLLSLLQDLVFCRVVVLPGEIYAAAIFTLQEDIKDATQIKMQLPPTGSCLYLQDGNLHLHWILQHNQLTINLQSTNLRR